MSSAAEAAERAALIARAPRLAKLLGTSDLVWCRRAVAAEEGHAAKAAAWKAEAEERKATLRAAAAQATGMASSELYETP